jgi:hypothetical protein
MHATKFQSVNVFEKFITWFVRQCDSMSRIEWVLQNVCLFIMVVVGQQQNYKHSYLMMCFECKFVLKWIAHYCCYKLWTFSLFNLISPVAHVQCLCPQLRHVQKILSTCTSRCFWENIAYKDSFIVQMFYLPSRCCNNSFPCQSVPIPAPFPSCPTPACCQMIWDRSPFAADSQPACTQVRLLAWGWEKMNPTLIPGGASPRELCYTHVQIVTFLFPRLHLPDPPISRPRGLQTG